MKISSIVAPIINRFLLVRFQISTLILLLLSSIYSLYYLYLSISFPSHLQLLYNSP